MRTFVPGIVKNSYHWGEEWRVAAPCCLCDEQSAGAEDEEVMNLDQTEELLRCSYFLSFMVFLNSIFMRDMSEGTRRISELCCRLPADQLTGGGMTSPR